MLVFARLFVKFRSDSFGGSRALIRNRVVFLFISRVCFVFVLWRCVYVLVLVWHIPAHRILRILTLWDPCTAEKCDLVANETGGCSTHAFIGNSKIVCRTTTIVGSVTLS